MKKLFAALALLLCASTAEATMSVGGGLFTARQYTNTSLGDYIYGYLFVSYSPDDDPQNAAITFPDGFVLNCPSPYCTVLNYGIPGLEAYFYSYLPGRHIDGSPGKSITAQVIGETTTINVGAFCDANGNLYCNGPDF